jgi:outer membrane protein TolC
MNGKPLFFLLGLMGVGLCFGRDLSAATQAGDALTLQSVLTAPLAEQYGVMGAAADLADAKANQALVDSWYDPTLSVHGQLRYIQPSNTATDPNTRHDNALGISARQRLYDFGRQSLRSDAAKAGVTGAQLNVFSTEQQQRLAVLKAFFAVLLADQTYTVQNERMAVEYVRLDKAKDRKELGLASEVDLAVLQRTYEDVLFARARADADRRLMRRQLAELLGTPDHIPGSLVAPKLAALATQKPPEFEAVIKSLLADNPGLQALRAGYRASEQSLQAARDHNTPTIYAEVNGDYYQRELSARDPLRAGVYIDFPLYDGGVRDASIGKAQAARMRLAAKIAEREAALREAAASTLEMIEVYRTAAISRVKALEHYSDLNFTRKQTLYQMEKATDLGDAMAEESAAQLERMRATYALATYWAQLAMLQGQPIDRILNTASQAPVLPLPTEPKP